MTRTVVSLFGVLAGVVASATISAAQSLPASVPALQAPVPVQACERRSSGQELITAIIAQTGGAPQAGHSRVSIAIDSYEAAIEPLSIGFEPEIACTICFAGPSRPGGGSVSIDGQVAHQIQLAQSMPRGSGRRVLVVLAPPSSLLTLPSGSSLDGPFGVIVLDVDSHGRGTGELIPSARLGLNGGGYVEVQQSLAPTQLLAEVKIID